MAWVARTPRTEPFRASSANVNIGPGSYETPGSIKSNRESYAPFASTAIRDTADVAVPSLSAPGPGQYNPSLVQRNMTGALCQPFQSQTSRFAHSINQNPGPGSYNLSNTSPSRSLPRKSSSLSVEFVRLPTVPTIPSHNCRYGFIDDDGVLMPHEPAKQPQELLPQPSSLSHTRGPVTFSKSSSTRDLWGTSRGKVSTRSSTTLSAPLRPVASVVGSIQTVTPGPASYRTDDVYAIDGTASNIAGTQRRAGRSAYLKYKPSAVFLSRSRGAKSKQEAQRGAYGGSIPHRTRTGLGSAPAADDTPGPGPALASAFDKAAQPAPVDKQCFLSRAPRTTALAAVSMTPGVGTYTPEAALAAFPAPAAVDAAHVLTGAVPAGQSAFRSKTVRLATAPAEDTPGVGAYDHTKGVQRKKTFSRNQTFGSTSSRFASAPRTIAETSALGPGVYRPEYATDMAAAVSRRPSPRRIVPPRPPRPAPAPDTSQARLQEEARRQAHPPCVGSYDLDTDGRLRASARRQQSPQHFLSKAPRFETAADLSRMLLASHRGPGAHYPTPAPVSHAVRAPFVSGGARFIQRSQADSTPGPGSYTRPPSLVKRSFNVTIEGGDGA